MPAFPDNLPLLPASDEMRQWDQNAIKFGLPELMLMENAGQALYSFIQAKFAPLEGKKFLLFMGGGNNGGDAACLGRHLLDAGGQATVLFTKSPENLPDAAACHFQLARADGVDLAKFSYNGGGASELFQLCEKHLHGLPDLIVDGLLGTGFQGNLKKSMEQLIEGINAFASAFHLPVLAIDTPSGLNCDTGQPQPVAIRAKWTASLAAIKKGQLLPQARQWTGEVIRREIGMPRNMEKPASMRLLDGRLMLEKLPFPAAGFKNSYGHVLVIGGSPGLSGAPHLAAMASLRSGTGLASVCAPYGLCAEIKAGVPEIMLSPVGGPEATDWPNEPDCALAEKIRKIHALVIGPGMGRSKNAAAFLEALLAMPRPSAVIDADAIRLLASNKRLLQFLRKDDIITPHPGEAGALLNLAGTQIQEDREGSLKRLCELAPATFILKGAGVLAAQAGHVTLLAPYDLPQMSIAGSGDVLSGCLGALLAMPQGMETLEIAARGVMRHLIAGMICAEKFPQRGCLASDLANMLAHVDQYLEKCDSGRLVDGFAPWP